MKAPLVCPNCGVDVPPKSSACPGCGSDENTGWSAAAGYAHTLHDDRPLPRGGRWAWIVGATAVVLVLAFIGGVVRNVYLFIAIAMVLAVALWLRLGAKRSASKSGSTARRAPSGFERLVALCYNDRAQAQRLVDAEAKRRPDTSDQELVERAIERLREDRRR